MLATLAGAVNRNPKAGKWEVGSGKGEEQVLDMSLCVLITRLRRPENQILQSSGLLLSSHLTSWSTLPYYRSA